MATHLENLDLDIASMNPKRFIVTCHGWSASNWTAHALNLSEHILCTHSARNELANDEELQSNANLKKHLEQLQKGYQLRQRRSLDELYDEIEKLGSSPNYGSVHVLRLRDLPVVYEKFGVPHRVFDVANVVRHPVTLAWSGYGQFKDLFRYDINELYWTVGKVINQGLDFVNYIAKKYNIYVGDYEHLAFIGACSVLSSLRLDLDAYPKVNKMENIDFKGTFQMERLTSEPEYYRGFLMNLGMEEVATENYLKEVMEIKTINKHKKDSKSLTPNERFETFSPMQKEVFNYFFQLNKLGEYEKFGYDLSMLE